MKHALLAASLLVGGFAFNQSARADYVLDVSQVGSNVVATGTGSINLTGLTFAGTSGASQIGVNPSEALVATGSSGATPDNYSGFTGPTSFGSGGGMLASSGSGDYVGIAGMTGTIAVPESYGSGNSLSSTATFDGQSLTSLGISPGTYTWTWDGGSTFTIVASVAPVPLPASVWMMLGSLTLLVPLGRKRGVLPGGQ